MVFNNACHIKLVSDACTFLMQTDLDWLNINAYHITFAEMIWIGRARVYAKFV